MANPYYTYSGAFIPGTLARAEQVATEYTSVQTGFAILAIQGTDSGAANAYVVTTLGGKDGIYTDGMIVEAKLLNGNTGACTIAVDGGATVGLIQPNGQSLASGAIVANTWYRAVYNSTYSAFAVVAPTPATTITSNTISAAAPTNKVGLTAAGGVSTACIPIDITFALDQSIAPTWTGAHTFSNAVTFNSTVSFAGGLSLTGGSSQYAATLTGNASAGHSLGLEVNAGVNNSDIALLINSQNAGTEFLRVNGVGSVTVGSPTGGAQGVGTINATGLFVNGAAVKTTSVSSANPTATIGLSAVNGVAATFMTSDSAPALSQAIAPTWTAAHVFTPSSAVTAVTINAAINAVGMAVVGATNTVNTYLLTFATAQGSGFSSGISLKAGTTSADNTVLMQNAAATQTYFQIKGDGSGSLGLNSSNVATIQFAASGTTTHNGAFTVNNVAGNSNRFVVSAGTANPIVQGYGPVAAALVDMTPDSGTFVMTLVAGNNTATGTAVWSRNGNQVTLLFPAMSSAATGVQGTALTATGLPASLRTSRTVNFSLSNLFFENNGASVVGTVQFASGSSTITFGNGGFGAAWTNNAGANGILTSFVITYPLN